MHARPQTSLAGTGDEPGPVIKSKAEAAALNKLFMRGESDQQFAVNKPGPSYNDFRAIRARLEALDRDRNCSKLQFLDRQGRKWSVAYHDSEKRACLVDEEARLESRTPCSVPSSIHIHTLTSATHIRGHCRHDRHRREVSRAALNRRSVSFGPTTKLPARRYRQRIRSCNQDRSRSVGLDPFVQAVWLDEDVRGRRSGPILQ